MLGKVLNSKIVHKLQQFINQSCGFDKTVIKFICWVNADSAKVKYINVTACIRNACVNKRDKDETSTNIMKIKRYQICANNYTFKTCPFFSHYIQLLPWHQIIMNIIKVFFSVVLKYSVALPCITKNKEKKIIIQSRTCVNMWQIIFSFSFWIPRIT